MPQARSRDDARASPGRDSRRRPAGAGPGGDWARLSRRAPGYLSTRLLADTARPDRFLTIDRWRSAQEHDDFKRRFRSEYEALDRACEKLTVHEASLGAYWEQPEGEA